MTTTTTTKCPSAFRNRCVFSVFRKLSALSDGSWRSSGSATENARRPSVLRRCRGTTRWWQLEYRSRWRLATSDVGWQQFTRYWGALPWRHGELSFRAYGGFAWWNFAQILQLICFLCHQRTESESSYFVKMKISPLTSMSPYLKCDVELQEGEY